jgi:hypothetical protein
MCQICSSIKWTLNCVNSTINIVSNRHFRQNNNLNSVKSTFLSNRLYLKNAHARKEKEEDFFGLYKVRFDVSFCRVLKFVLQIFSNFIVNINTVFVKINHEN